MRINAKDYLEAARDRITDAHNLYDIGRYSFSLYAAGLAVESLFRAYRILRNPEFDERHDLKFLFAESEIEKFVTTPEHVEISDLNLAVYMRWKNDLRFASEDRLRRRLKKLGLARGLKGDFLKENSRLSIAAATRIIKIGVAKWPHR